MTGTATILNSIVSALTALTWTPPGGGAAEPAFGAVHAFAQTSLHTAVRKLLVSKTRVAIVMPGGAEFEQMPSGTSRIVRRMLRVGVLVSDRVIGDPLSAYFGNETTPGAWGLGDLISSSLIGRIVPNPGGVDIVPVRIEEGAIEDDENPQQPGRAICSVDFECRGGGLTTSSTITYGPVA